MICVNDLDMGQTRSIQNLQSNLVLQRDEVEDKAVLAKQACPSIRCVSISVCWVFLLFLFPFVGAYLWSFSGHFLIW